MTPSVPRTLWLAGVLLVGGCGYDQGDPFRRPGTYSPTGANEANLRAMVAEPEDLLGRPAQRTSMGAEAAPPVARLLSGKRYPLPIVNAATAVSSGSEQQPAPGNNNPGPP